MRKLLAIRWAQAVVLCCVMVGMLGANGPSHRFDKLGHEMICTCSCGQILLECNHVGCPVSEPMIGELRTQLAAGGTDTSILNWFAAKYGAIVLAAPIRGGFDNVAWIAPMLVFFLATIGTAVIVRVWKLRSVQRAPAAPSLPGNAQASALRERIRRETEY
jgi:cytochrome c-type biogenesis protein CcmH/NrfF